MFFKNVIYTYTQHNFANLFCIAVLIPHNAHLYHAVAHFRMFSDFATQRPQVFMSLGQSINKIKSFHRPSTPCVELLGEPLSAEEVINTLPEVVKSYAHFSDLVEVREMLN